MIDVIHGAFMEELKKIAAVGTLYKPAVVGKAKKKRSTTVRNPKIKAMPLPEPVSVPGDGTIQTLSS
jgi:hypothetical protein